MKRKAEQKEDKEKHIFIDTKRELKYLTEVWEKTARSLVISFIRTMNGKG